MNVPQRPSETYIIAPESSDQPKIRKPSLATLKRQMAALKREIAKQQKRIALERQIQTLAETLDRLKGEDR